MILRSFRRCAWPGPALAALAVLAGGVAAVAQEPADLGFERRVGPSRDAIAPPAPRTPTPALTVPAPTPPARRLAPGAGAATAGVLVERVDVRGSTRLAHDDLRAVVEPFEGRALSVPDIVALRDAVTQAYVDAGYITSGAVVPAQDLADGTLQLEVVEGGLEQIVVRGTARLDASYVRARLERAIAEPLHLDDVEAALQRLLRDPVIARLDARLGPGTARGLAILEIDVEEADPVAAQITIANDRAPSVGGTRGTLLAVAPNTFGFGDETRLEFTAVEGGPEAALSYSVPLGASGLRAFASGKVYRLDVVEAPLDDLDITATSNAVAAGLVFPIAVGRSGELRLSASVDRQFTQTTLEDRAFSFAPGAEDGATAVTALRLTQDGEWRSTRRVLAVRSTVSFGLDAFDATVHGDGTPDGQFASWFAQGLWVERLSAGGRRLIAQANLQLADDALLPVEQLAIGGSDTVRGYRTNTLVRDSGWTASLELRQPLFQLTPGRPPDSPADGRVEAVVFTDHGGGWNLRRPTPSPQSIHAVGAGLRWRASPRVEIGLDAGLPLRDAPRSGEDTLQDLGVHFRIDIRPF